MKLPNFLIKVLAVFLVLYSTVSNAEPGCIGVVTAGGGIEFWDKVGEGAIHAGGESHTKVVVRGPKDASSTCQSKIFDQMIEYGCFALVVAPTDITELSKLQEHAGRGIAIVLIDRDFGSKQFNTVKTDNYKAGVLAAHEMLKQTGVGAKIGLLRLNQDVPSTTDRENGFLTTATKAGLKVVLDEYIGASVTEANAKAYEILKANPNLEGLFTPNESTTLAVLNMRKRTPTAMKLKHIGFDSHPEFIQAIKDDHLTSVLVQRPFNMGYLAVKKVLELRKKPSNQSHIETPVLVLNKTNIDQRN